MHSTLQPGDSLVAICALSAVTCAILGLCCSCHEARADQQPLYAFCGTGDHLWVRDREPVDSPATVDAMLEWMSKTYGISRLYWRGGQTHIWDQHYKVGPESPLQYDWAMWKRHLYRDLRLNEATVASAKRHGMEIFLYSGLFEHGVQPDVGIICPYPFEDRLRIEHPEWCMVDRWGERRCPGPIAMCYPEARKAIIDRYVEAVNSMGYDGINFYTYVENVGLRYEDEFGFNQPIVDEFARRYPQVNLRRDELTPEQKQYWYECRGKFVTQFIRELSGALSATGKKLSMILDAENPDYPQPWWGKEYPGTGMIRLEWQTWIDEGLVDEIWVQLGPQAAQTALLDTLLRKCEGTPVKLTVRTPDPFGEVWRPYVKKGVTPVAVITWARNGIERVTLEPTSPETLQSKDWRLRLQTVGDAEQGKLTLPAADVARLAQDEHVLVRRRVVYALAALGDASQVPVIENALADPESSVSIAAAGALAKLHGIDSPARILAALENGGRFQFKLACVEALAAMGGDCLPQVVAGLQSPEPRVREVCVRALYDIGKSGLHEQVFPHLLATFRDPDEDGVVRYWAIDGAVGLRLKVSDPHRTQLTEALLAVVDEAPPPLVQLHAAWGLGYLPAFMDPDTKALALDRLATLFAEFGDGCTRPDAAFGWRVVGNALIGFWQPGRDKLDELCRQTDDKWLAWAAYDVLYVPQRFGRQELIDGKQAAETHDAHAPEFPGWRTW